MLSSVFLIFGTAIFATYCLITIRAVDRSLEWVSQKVLDTVTIDVSGKLATDVNAAQISRLYTIHVWSRDGQLIDSSQNAEDTDEPLSRLDFNDARQVHRNVKINHIPFRVLSSPIVVDEQNEGLLQVGVSMETQRVSQRFLLFILVVSAAILILLSWHISWIRVGKFVEPITMMAEIADTITMTNDLSKRIPFSSRPNEETNHIVLIFNQTLARLERLFNSQNRFLADVTHELRTPLTVIKGNVGLMRMIKEYDEEALTSIESEVDRLTRLVGDLLIMTQAETGNLPLFFDVIEVDKLLFDIYEEMQVLSKGQRDIQIDEIEPAIVTGDRDRLKQVFLNLGSNAIKYSPPGAKINLSLSLHDSWVLVKVRDEGQGIPKEELSLIFERLYRGDKSRSRSKASGGFGLGLPIAYWIVYNHGGRIEVESESGEGTTFTVWLPVSQMDVPTRPLKSRRQR